MTAFAAFIKENMDPGAPFLGASDDYERAQKVIFGAPMDWTVSFRPGSRFGPASIRQVSPGLEEYSLYQDKSLNDCAFFDAGDLALPFGNPSASLKMIEEAVTLVLDDKKVPLMLGGEHLVSLGAIAALHKVFPDLVVLHFDAHADLRLGYFDEPLSHASVIRRVCELEPAIRVFQFGIRSGDREEFVYASQRTKLFHYEVAAPVHKILPDLAGTPVYLSIDIDVADPAFAPGTGTPEPGGITSSELIQAVLHLSRVNLVGADIVEVAPDYDLSKRTPFLAAKLLRELLLF